MIKTGTTNTNSVRHCIQSYSRNSYETPEEFSALENLGGVGWGELHRHRGCFTVAKIAYRFLYLRCFGKYTLH